MLGLLVAGITEMNARAERGRLHSFLKGLRAAVFAGEAAKAPMLGAINDEMARLIPPGRSFWGRVMDKVFGKIDPSQP